MSIKVKVWVPKVKAFDVLREVLLLKEHYNNNHALCHVCGACRTVPGLEYMAFATDAPVRMTRLSSAE